MRANLKVRVYESLQAPRDLAATEVLIDSKRIFVTLDTDEEGTDHQGESSDPPQGEVKTFDREHCSARIVADW